jgi:hypothetical protein
MAPAVRVRRFRSESKRTVEARTIREMPKRRRFRVGSIPILGVAETGSN